MKCRHCGAELTFCVVDLGSAPPSNAYLTVEAMKAPEKWFPLKVMVCDACWLMQTEDFAKFDELFEEDYAYFSSFSKSWLVHAEAYVHEMVDRFGLETDSMVVEVAANDGYLLQYVKQAGISCLGIEPTAGTAKAARKKGIEIVEEFFGEALGMRLAAEGKKANLTAANNVLAHVPDINDFVRGFAAILKPEGVSTFEFPSLLRLLDEAQFDTIYHEHFSYLSLIAVNRIFTANGLTVFDIEELSTHGGSLRVFAQRSDTMPHPISETVTEMLERETRFGLSRLRTFSDFEQATQGLKNAFLKFLIEAKEDGKTVAAYGAAAKGNTFLNYAGIRPDLIEYVIDANPAKQHKFMPGSRIPILAQDYLQERKPDYIVILPWNLQTEISKQLEYTREWGAKFVTAIPQLRIF